MQYRNVRFLSPNITVVRVIFPILDRQLLGFFFKLDLLFSSSDVDSI